MNEEDLLFAAGTPSRASRVVILAKFSADQSKGFFQCRGRLWLRAVPCLPLIVFAFGNRNSSLGVSGLALDDVNFRFRNVVPFCAAFQLEVSNHRTIHTSFCDLSVACKGSRSKTVSHTSVGEQIDREISVVIPRGVRIV